MNQANDQGARAAILASIRGSRGEGGQQTAESEYANLSRQYERSGELDLEARLKLFEERLREYDAGVYRSSAAELAEGIAEILAKREKSRLIIPKGLPAAWLPPGFVFAPGDELPPLDLDHYDGVITACTVAIALTGTLILQSVPGQGPRKLSLVPDYHLCIVSTGQLVETVPEAMDRIRETATLPTTFISGPSATADIEMTRIKGVHGPRSLDVLLIV